MKGFDVLHVKSAVRSRNKFDLSCSHLTTMDFGEIVPLYVADLVPGDKFSVQADFFSRMAPLVKPTYGKFSFKTVSGYVPLHQLADDAEAWLAGKTTWEGQTPKPRFISAGYLEGFVRRFCVDSTGASASSYDYGYINTSGAKVYTKFTTFGKYAVKVLNALGYAIPQGADLRTSSVWWTSRRINEKFSAYPFLAFFKLYNDYMSQSQRYNTSALSSALYQIKHGIVNDTIWNASTGNITDECLKLFFDNLKLNYENDYFTSAWQNPNSPLQNSESIDSVVVPKASNLGADSVTLRSDNSNNYADLAPRTGGNNIQLSQRVLDMLKMFDNWVRRNNYSGSRAVQQLYSRFGIKTDDYRSNYANVISTDTMPIQVGDVTATADSQDVPLGDYAGKAIMNGTDNIQYDCDDFGVLLILGYFTVTPMNSFGFDRSVLRVDPLDYYNPEFDGIGADAISYGELFANTHWASIDDTTPDTNIFGFTERYNSYRYGRDKITGEFRSYDPTGDMNTWHTGRLLNQVRKDGEMVAQSSTMNTLESGNSQYNRIFSITTDRENHFYLTCKFNVSAIRPMLNLNQVVNLGEGNTAVPRNGNVIA